MKIIGTEVSVLLLIFVNIDIRAELTSSRYLQSVTQGIDWIKYGNLFYLLCQGQFTLVEGIHRCGIEDRIEE